MARFTDQQYGLIQSYVEFTLDRLHRLGFGFDLDTDMAAWAELMRGAPSIAAVTTTFDPEHSYLHPRNCFWSKLIDGRGQVVGCIATRLFVTEDIIEELRSYRLFYDRKPVIDFRVLQLVAPEEIPHIHGRVGYFGGLWLHPDCRGMGLSELFGRLNRALALRHFSLDWACALNKDTAKRRAMVKETYGYAGRFSCFDGYFPPRNADGQYQLVHAHRGEMLALIKSDLAAAGLAPRPVTVAAE